VRVCACQVQAESKLSGQDDELRRLRAQVEELARQVQDLNGLKAKLTHENFELHRQVQELDSNNAALAKLRVQLQQQLDEAKARLEEESRVSDDCILLTRITALWLVSRTDTSVLQVGARVAKGALTSAFGRQKIVCHALFDKNTAHTGGIPPRNDSDE